MGWLWALSHEPASVDEMAAALFARRRREKKMNEYESIKLDGEGENDLGILTPGMAEVQISPGE